MDLAQAIRIWARGAKSPKDIELFRPIPSVLYRTGYKDHVGILYGIAGTDQTDCCAGYFTHPLGKLACKGPETRE
jgi:hypothetical protein